MSRIKLFLIFVFTILLGVILARDETRNILYSTAKQTLEQDGEDVSDVDGDFTHTCKLDKVFSEQVMGATECVPGLLCIAQGRSLYLAKNDDTLQVLDMYSDGSWNKQPEKETVFSPIGVYLYDLVSIPFRGKNYLLAKRAGNYGPLQQEFILFEILNQKIVRRELKIPHITGNIDYMYDHDTKHLLVTTYNAGGNIMGYEYDFSDPENPVERLSLQLGATARVRYYSKHIIMESSSTTISPASSSVKVYDLTDLGDIKLFEKTYQGFYDIFAFDAETKRVVFLEADGVGVELSIGNIDQDWEIRFAEAKHIPEITFDFGAIYLKAGFTSNKSIAISIYGDVYYLDYSSGQIKKIFSQSPDIWFKPLVSTDPSTLFISHLDGLSMIQSSDFSKMSEATVRRNWISPFSIDLNASLLADGKLLSLPQVLNENAEYFVGNTQTSKLLYPQEIAKYPLPQARGIAKSKYLKTQFHSDKALISQIRKDGETWLISSSLFLFESNSWKFLKQYSIPIPDGTIARSELFATDQIELELAVASGKYTYLMIKNYYADQLVLLILDTIKPEQNITLINSLDVPYNPDVEPIETMAVSQGILAIMFEDELIFYDTNTSDGEPKFISRLSDPKYTVHALVGATDHGFIISAYGIDSPTYSVMLIDPKTLSFKNATELTDVNPTHVSVDGNRLYEHRGYRFSVYEPKITETRSGKRKKIVEPHTNIINKQPILHCYLPTGIVKSATLQDDALYLFRDNFIELYKVTKHVENDR